MNPICVTCGTQYGYTDRYPERCPICEDERQYVGFEGQQWTDLEEVRAHHQTPFTEEEPQLLSVTMQPAFGIGQRAFLVQTGGTNVLWDCLTLLDSVALAHINTLGGLHAIAISHPHYYTCMLEWSEAFGNIPIYLHAADREWVMRPDDRIQYWGGETHALDNGLTLIRCGGHFDGASVLHWPQGADGRGVLLTGDTIQVSPDRKSVSFMYSYPNCIPLSREKVKRIVTAVEPYAFDRLYGAFAHRTVANNGKRSVTGSAERYIRSIAY